MAIAELPPENYYKIGFGELPCHINVEGEKVIVSVPSNNKEIEGLRTFAFSKTEVKRMFEEVYTS